MVIEIINLKELIKKAGDIGDTNVMPVIRKSVRKVQSSAKDFAPEDTGILKASIKTKMYPKQLSGIVYTTTEYAPHQEFGTRFQSGTPFMNPAMETNRDTIIKDMSEFLSKSLRKYKK